MPPVNVFLILLFHVFKSMSVFFFTLLIWMYFWNIIPFYLACSSQSFFPSSSSATAAAADATVPVGIFQVIFKAKSCQRQVSWTIFLLNQPDGYFSSTTYMRNAEEFSGDLVSNSWNQPFLQSSHLTQVRICRRKNLPRFPRNPFFSNSSSTWPFATASDFSTWGGSGPTSSPTRRTIRTGPSLSVSLLRNRDQSSWELWGRLRKIVREKVICFRLVFFVYHWFLLCLKMLQTEVIP